MKISPDKLDTRNLPIVLRAIQSVLQEHELDFCLVGAQARDIQLLVHGQKTPRATRDVDIAMPVEESLFSLFADKPDAGKVMIACRFSFTLNLAAHVMFR